MLALWDSPRQREAYTWFTAEFANLRTAFRWAADQGDLDTAAIIATYAPFLGLMVEQYEPIAWAEELIEPARAVDHPRLAFLYVMASQCFLAGRPEAAVCYSDAGQRVIGDDCAEVPYGFQGLLGGAYQFIGQSERSAEWRRAQIVRGCDTHTLTRAALVLALTNAERHEEAMAATKGLIDAAEATRNPSALLFALLAYGTAFLDADPDRAREAMRRGVVIAQDSGNRFNETHLASNLAGLEALHGDPLAAFDYLTLAIRNLHDWGNSTTIRGPLAILAVFLDRLGRYEAAATIAGFVLASPFGAVVFSAEVGTAIAHLRNVLGEATYESLAQRGETMTITAMVTYAYDQIDQARTGLNAVSE